MTVASKKFGRHLPLLLAAQKLPAFAAFVKFLAIMVASFLLLRELTEDHAAIVTITNCGGHVIKRSIVPTALRKYLCRPIDDFFDRADVVRLPDHFWISNNDQTDELIRALRELRRLRIVIIEGPSVEGPDPPPKLRVEAIKAALPGVSVMETTN